MQNGAIRWLFFFKPLFLNSMTFPWLSLKLQNSRTFPGLDFFISNSRTFAGLQDLCRVGILSRRSKEQQKHLLFSVPVSPARVPSGRAGKRCGSRAGFWAGGRCRVPDTRCTSVACPARCRLRPSPSWLSIHVIKTHVLWLVGMNMWLYKPGRARLTFGFK